MDFDKIVRDNVPKIIEDHGRKYTIKTVNSGEAIEYLIKKIHEEADEVEKTWNNGEGEGRMIEELGDVLECVRGITSKISVPMDRLEWARENKAIKIGRYENNIILLYCEGEKF